MSTPPTGIHYGITISEYLGWDAVNQSSLKEILDSPAHCYHAMTADKGTTEALLTGQALHCAALEPDRFARDYLLWEKVPGKGPEAFKKAQAESFLSLYSSEWNVPEMAKALREDPHSAALLAQLHGRAEVSIIWEDESGVRCKARLDGLYPRLVFDCKTMAGKATSRACANACMKHRYWFQAAFTLRGLKALGHSADAFALVFIEKKPPHAVNTFWVAGDLLEVAHRNVSRALAKYRHCMATGVWPGPGAGGTTVMDCPPWFAAGEDLTQEMSDE